MSLDSNYEIHFSGDISSLAILQVDHTEVWFIFFSIRIYFIMISSSDLKEHHISILHYCNKGVRSARKIHHETNIPLRTIYCNRNKLNQLNSLKYWAGNSQPRVLSWIGEKAIRKCIRHKNEITLNQIKENLSTTYHSSVSISTIRRDLHAYVCENVLPKSIHMLTTHDKKATCRMT